MPDNSAAVTLSKYRMEKAEEMLCDATKLLESNSLKSANNRAYYAIFHAMRAVLALDGVEYKKHSGNITYFMRDYIRTGIFATEMADIITSASLVRNASDYDDFYITSQDEAKAQVEGAGKFIFEIKKYLDNHYEKTSKT